MKINWSFILGIVFGLAFIGIGMINNKLTDGEYASALGSLLMLIWFGGFFMLVKDEVNAP